MTSFEDDLSKETRDLKVKDDQFINILLLGETGVGKSTFINSIANYLTHNEFKKAEKEKLIKLIPSKCKVQDKHGEYHIIQIGAEDDQNECLDTGMSATQDVKSYVFPIWNGAIKVRLIDTPGIGDVRGIEQDNINCENILSYIGQLHELHAICYLFKPTNPRITVYFDYCMTQILSRLDKSASKNIIFIFTNTRGTDYGPGETFPSLQKVIDGIKSRPPHVEIPLKKNIFCFDNEAFRYLAAIKQSIEFDNSIKQRNIESWKRSVEQCNKLIKYIVGDSKQQTKCPPLKPHFIKSTSAINEARRLIVQLSQPLAEISQLINDNLFILQRHKENLDTDSYTLEELKKKLYMPVIDLDVTKLTQPVTVCTSKNCAEIYKVENLNKFHYKQRCHDPCYLKNVPKEIIGSPELVNCAAIDNRTKACRVCCCDFSAHMHIYYMTKTVDRRIVDNNIKQNIDNKEKLMETVKKLIENITRKKDELEMEHNIIIKACARFAHFLQNNAITPFSDSYKEYIEYLIMRERSLGVLSKMSVIHHLQNVLQEYEAAKQSFDEALAIQKRLGEADVLITPQKIQESIQDLYKLKHNGKKIKELYECQKKSRSKEHKNTEYVHEVLSQLQEDRRKKEKVEGNKNVKKNTSDQKRTFNKPDGNQKNYTQPKGRSESRDRRNRTPPPAYQDVPPTRQHHVSSTRQYHVPPTRQYHPPPHDPYHHQERPYHPPSNYPEPPYYHHNAPRPDYGVPSPSYSAHYGYRDQPPPGPLYRPYDPNFHDPHRDERDMRSRDSRDPDSYEFKVTVNRPPPPSAQTAPPGEFPPPQTYPPRDPYRQDFYPTRSHNPYYVGPEHFNRDRVDGYYSQTNVHDPRQNQRRPPNRPTYNNASNRGRGGFRGGRGQTQKFKNVSHKKKNVNPDSDSDSNTD